MKSQETENRLVLFVSEIRKSILGLGLAIFACSIGSYIFSPELFEALQTHLDQHLVFYTPAEPFLAHVRLSVGFAVFCLAPLLAFFFWKAMAGPFKLSLPARYFFTFFTIALFYAGSIFCYLITLPYGINFLLSFQSEQLQPVISIGKFISFVTVFVLAFGLIFELPVFMVFAGRTGIIPRSRFEGGRRYALLAISIAAALLTPTPDIVNMMLMGVPLYLLYEFGIIVMRCMKI